MVWPFLLPNRKNIMNQTNESHATERAKTIIVLIGSIGMVILYFAWPHIDYFKSGLAEHSKPPIALLILGALGASYGFKSFSKKAN